VAGLRKAGFFCLRCVRVPCSRRLVTAHVSIFEPDLIASDLAAFQVFYNAAEPAYARAKELDSLMGVDRTSSFLGLLPCQTSPLDCALCSALWTASPGAASRCLPATHLPWRFLQPY
jgi:hypothetical protein